MAKAKSKTKDPNKGLKDRIGKKLRELEQLSPREIKDHIGHWRRGFNQNDGLLANWLKDELDLEQVTAKGINNLNDNLEVVVHIATSRIVLPFHVGTSVQEFLGNRKDSAHAVSGVSLSPDQAVLIRAVVDREGGDEPKLVKTALLVGIVNMPVIRNFVKQLKKHPEWHKGMHEAGLYPADIFHAWENVEKEVKELAKQAT